MTDNLKKWIEENKLIVSESKTDGFDTIIIDDVGKFLFLQPNEEGKVIDGDFSFILSDEEFEILDNHKVDYILYEFGGRFYYSGIKSSKNKYNEIIYQPEFIDFKYIGKCSEPFVMDFVHLGVHDEYEMLSGSGSVELWCKKAKFLGHKAIGVCNNNSLASSLSFQTNCERTGLKCVLGETITVARNFNPNEEIQETFELKLYVMSNVGWKNLLLISKIINVDYNGFIPAEELYIYGEGLTCVIPKESEFNYLVNNEKRKEATKLLATYKKSFDNVYYQIDTVEYSSEQLFREHLTNIDNYICFFRKLVKPILINDSYYLDLEMQPLKGMLHKVSGKAAPEAKNQYFKSVSDIISAYDEWIEDTELLFDTIISGIENTVVLTNKVNFVLDESNRKMPSYEVDDPEALFFDELQKGIEKRLVGKVDNIDDYMKRIEYECGIIVPNDLCSYFLILWDICNWCRKEDIVVGPGRGSVCGSLVAYCLNITSVDPLKYNLYFERFLNVARVSAFNEFILTMSDGERYVFKQGDNIPLTDGTQVIADKDIDFTKLDIDVEKVKNHHRV